MGIHDTEALIEQAKAMSDEGLAKQIGYLLLDDDKSYGDRLEILEGEQKRRNVAKASCPFLDTESFYKILAEAKLIDRINISAEQTKGIEDLKTFIRRRVTDRYINP